MATTRDQPACSPRRKTRPFTIDDLTKDSDTLVVIYRVPMHPRGIVNCNQSGPMGAMLGKMVSRNIHLSHFDSALSFSSRAPGVDGPALLEGCHALSSSEALRDFARRPILEDNSNSRGVKAPPAEPARRARRRIGLDRWDYPP